MVNGLALAGPIALNLLLDQTLESPRRVKPSRSHPPSGSAYFGQLYLRFRACGLTGARDERFGARTDSCTAIITHASSVRAAGVSLSQSRTGMRDFPQGCGDALFHLAPSP